MANTVDFIALPALAQLTAVGHFVSTRGGGVSAPPFDSLNLSYNVGDDPAAVEANWARVRIHLPGELATPNQCHGARILTIARAEDAGAEPADGLVTSTRGLVVAVLVADCAPVLAADPIRGVVGVAHAGWRGTVAGVTPSLIEAMCAAGAAPADIHLAVGPCIGWADYEVGEEVAHAVRATFATEDWPRLLRPSNRAGAPAGGSEAHEVVARRWLLDLAAANVCQALASGVEPARVSRSQWSTRGSSELFFSHRGSAGPTGRFAAGIWLAA